MNELQSMELSNTDYQNREEKEENNNTMSLQPMQLSVESGSTSSQRTQPICKICQGNHGFRFCPNTVCGLYQKKGHIKRDYLLFKCSKCRRQGHNRQECGKQCFRCHEYHVNTTICPPIEKRKKSPKEIKGIQQKEKECNYCYQKGHIEYYCETKEIYQKNLNIECGCSEGMIYRKRRNYRNNKTKFHCDKCHMPNEESKIDIVTELGGRKKLYCHECQYFFMLVLLYNHEQQTTILGRLEKEGLIRNCYVCQRKNLKRRMHNEGQSFFCTREEKYGTMAYWEVSDPTRNYDLATRINHHCYSSKSAGSAYDMNIDKIFRIAKVLLGQTELTMDQALKE
ncbi:hypothetical protein F8M41_017323 [Gigaspora margarita]|uniref:Uncharacterized protein n=1 Tax=Gigaspora margarita TaxID=4874 RepID=A0A8H4AN72_GIGMA|nr:hypothetical protein F8M41_017323 [Gigaspora margarita]